MADTMMWILHKKGLQHALHYLHDFLIMGPAESDACQLTLGTSLAMCAELGFAVAPEKTELTFTELMFLGLEINSLAGQVHLPAEKLSALLATLDQWVGKTRCRSSCKKRDLLSFICTMPLP